MMSEKQRDAQNCCGSLRKGVFGWNKRPALHVRKRTSAAHAQPRLRAGERGAEQRMNPNWRRVSILALALVQVVLLTPAAFAQGTVVIREPMPHPRWPQRVTTTPLTLKYQRINVEITDGVAVTQVQQTFVNPSGMQIEGT